MIFGKKGVYETYSVIESDAEISTKPIVAGIVTWARIFSGYVFPS